MSEDRNILVLYSNKELLHFIDGFALPDQKVEKRRGQLRIGRIFIQHCEGRPVDAQVFHGHEYSQIFFIGNFSHVFKQRMMATVRTSQRQQPDTIQQGQKSEADYRRGYQQGYDMAIRNMKPELKNAVSRLIQFSQNQLNGWRHEQRADRKIGPPEYPQSYLGSGKDTVVLEVLNPGFGDSVGNGSIENLDRDAIRRSVSETRSIEPEPTRPSEDDMVNKPESTHYVMHPQFRDIGVRIDRYGSLVFKPELVDNDEA